MASKVDVKISKDDLDGPRLKMCCRGCLRIIDWFPEVARRNIPELAQAGLFKDRKVTVPCPKCGFKNRFEIPRKR